MDVAEVLKVSFKALVLPPSGPLLLAILGLVLWRRTPRLSRGLVLTGVGALFLLSLPIVASVLVVAAGGGKAVDAAQLAAAQAIVVPGGGSRPDASEYGGDTLGRLSLERARYAASLARETKLPVLVSGGGLPDRPTEASLLRAALEQEFGVPVRWVEQASLNTRENAQLSASILHKADIHTVALVVHGFDVRRARAEYEATGLRVVMAPTHVGGLAVNSVRDFLPSASALLVSYYATYELAGYLALRWRGD